MKEKDKQLKTEKKWVQKLFANKSDKDYREFCKIRDKLNKEK